KLPESEEAAQRRPLESGGGGTWLDHNGGPPGRLESARVRVRVLGVGYLATVGSILLTRGVFSPAPASGGSLGTCQRSRKRKEGTCHRGGKGGQPQTEPLLPRGHARGDQSGGRAPRPILVVGRTASLENWAPRDQETPERQRSRVEPDRQRVTVPL